MIEGDGRPRFILDLAKALSRHVELVVLAPHASGLSRSETMEGVSVERFRYLFPASMQTLAAGDGVAANLRRSWWARLQVPLFMVGQIVGMMRLIRRFRPEVVNCHWLIPQGLSAAVIGWVTKVPMVLHVHAADVYFLRNRFWGPSVARFVVKRAKAIYADGSHVRDALDLLLGFSSGANLRPMGVWTSEFAPDRLDTVPRSSRSLVFVGRLVEKKGLTHLLHAMTRLVDRYPDTELTVIGDGPLKDSLVAEAHLLKLDERVHFVGPLPHRELVQYLHRAEVACVPSIIDSRGETDGMPTVVVEAMASGIKVVGSRVDGIPDVLRDGKNGWLALPGDAVDLARAIGEAFDTGNDRQARSAALATADAHDWDSVAAEYFDTVQEIVV